MQAFIDCWVAKRPIGYISYLLLVNMVNAALVSIYHQVLYFNDMGM